jgi:hypothetical protein
MSFVKDVKRGHFYPGLSNANAIPLKPAIQIRSRRDSIPHVQSSSKSPFESLDIDYAL